MSLLTLVKQLAIFFGRKFWRCLFDPKIQKYVYKICNSKKEKRQRKSRSIVGGEMNAPAKNVQRAANESDHRGFPRELHELVERRCRRRRRRALPLPRAAAASAAVNSSCRFSCTKKRGLERARHYRRACRCRRAAIAPAPSYKVKAASYDNILLRRCTGARKPALPIREAWPFINRQPDHRKTRFYTWQSSVVARLLQRSAQKSDPTVPGFSWVFDRACTSSPADLIVTFSCWSQSFLVFLGVAFFANADLAYDIGYT